LRGDLSLKLLAKRVQNGKEVLAVYLTSRPTCEKHCPRGNNFSSMTHQENKQVELSLTQPQIMTADGSLNAVDYRPWRGDQSGNRYREFCLAVVRNDRDGNDSGHSQPTGMATALSTSGNSL